MAVAKGLYSGTYQALLKESLHAEGRGSNYRYYAGAFHAVSNSFQLVAVLGGGVLGLYSLRATAVISAVMSVLSLLVFLQVRDVGSTAGRQADIRGGARGILASMWRGIQNVWHDPGLWCASTCFGVILAGAQHLLALRQPYALSIGLAPAYFGIFEASAMLAMIAAGWCAQRTHLRHDRLWLLLMGGALFGGTIICGVFSGDGGLWMATILAMYCLARSTATFAAPVLEDIIQQRKIDTDRATVLSIGTFTGYALVAVTGPIIQALLGFGWTVPATVAAAGITGALLYGTLLLSSRWFWGPAR